jgi:hypothetical protein
MIIDHRRRQTDTDISVPRLVGLKESSRSRVKNPLIWNIPEGSTFCFAIVGKAKSLCLSRERSERVVNKNLASLGARQVYPLLGFNPKPGPPFGLSSGSKTGPDCLS